MFQLLSLVKYLFLGFLFLIIFALYQLIISPLIKLYPYKRKGANVYFFPIIGSLKINLKDFETKGDLLADSRETGKNFPNQKYSVTNMANNIMITLTDPQYVKEFLQKQANYKKASFLGLLAIVGSGLVFAEGEQWKRHRKIISNSFHYEFLKKNISVIQGTVQEFLGKIRKEDCKDFPVIQKIQEITGEVIGRIFFGERLNDYTLQEKPLTLALAEVMSELAVLATTATVTVLGPKVLYLPFVPRYKRLMDKVKGIRRICYNIIQDRKANSHQAEDLLGLILSTQKSEDAEQRFSDEDIINEFVTFFSAGMDSTGHMVALALYNLTQYPHLIQSLKEEITATYNTEKRVTADTLQKMDKIHSLLKETLRFYTPFPGLVPREAMKDHMLMELNIKKGTLMSFDFLAMFNNEKYFDNPERFDPTRWSRNEPKLDPYAFVPFSAGARNCLGQHLAIMEAKVIMSEFLNRFRFTLKEDYQLKMTFRFTYEPSKEILFNLTQIS